MFNTGSLTANGTFGPFTHGGGPLNWAAKGTFGSGTVSVQSDIGAGFTEVASVTADDEGVLDIPAGSRYQIVLTGATSPSLTLAVRS